VGQFDEPRLDRLRRLIEEQYASCPTACGASFGEILCDELDTQGLTFCGIAANWGISLATLGRLLADHCERLEEDPRVNQTRFRASTCLR
jgi:hypothetical protein